MSQTEARSRTLNFFGLLKLISGVIGGLGTLIGLVAVFYPPHVYLPKALQYFSDRLDDVNVTAPDIGRHEIHIAQLGILVRETSTREGQTYPSCTSAMRCLKITDMDATPKISGLAVDDIILAVDDMTDQCGPMKSMPGYETFPAEAKEQNLRRLLGLAAGNLLRKRACVVLIRDDKIGHVTVTRTS